MPVQSCSSAGKSGFRWGKSGKCYTGPGAKKRAALQGRAIKANQSSAKREMRSTEVII